METFVGSCAVLSRFMLSLHRMKTLNRYRAEVHCDYPEWSRYQVDLLCGAFDEQGVRVACPTADDRATAKGATAPVVLETPPCHHARLFLYVVAQSLPAESSIEATPPFEVEVRLFVNDRPLRTGRYAVNQWGGLSVEIALNE